jgi:murein L,D-transpeptidase YafK
MFISTILNSLAALSILAALSGYAWAQKVDLVIVHKEQRVLKLLSGGDLVRQYRVALGSNPRGHKRHEGDGRTPEGVYRIDWRNPDSKFHLSLHIDYPRPDDVSAAAAVAADPGKDIMIHGLPEGFTPGEIGHPRRDWTSGCIAVTNAEIEEIWTLVEDGTAILILPR